MYVVNASFDVFAAPIDVFADPTDCVLKMRLSCARKEMLGSLDMQTCRRLALIRDDKHDMTT
jgi:hypothetical protein